MDFLTAVKLSNDSESYVRRKCWAEGVALFVAKPSGSDCKKHKYSKESLGKPYIATCHVAACELGGVRTLEDILADDWELMYPKAV